MRNHAALLIALLFVCACADSKGQTPTPALELLQVLPASKRVEVGEHFQLGAQRVLGKTAENVTAQTTLRSDDESIVSVSYDSEQGAVARALRAGTAHILADYEGMSGMAEVIVSAAVTAVQLDPTQLVLPVGTSKQLDGVLIAGDTKRTLDGGTWGSADPAIASVSDDGLLTAQAAGETTITLTRAGLTASQRVRVAMLELASAQLTASSGAQLPAAGSAVLRVSGTFSDEARERTADITSLFTFATSPEMAPVTLEGSKVSAGSEAGTATIVATGKPGTLAADRTLELEVEVIPQARLLALSIDVPDALALNMQAVEFRVLGDFGNGLQLEFKPEKLFVEPATALSIDLQGFTLTPLMAASATLTASQTITDESGMVEPRVIEVMKPLRIESEPLSLLSVGYDGDNPVPRVGESQQLTATAFYGPYGQVVTDRVLWSSDDPSVVVVSNVDGGLVTAVGPGSTMVRASFGGQVGSFTAAVRAF